MAIGITKEQLDRVHALIIDKNVAGAWKLLADFGDRYAEGAYAVLADPTSPYAVMVRTHWENLDADFGKFNTVALRHVQQYVDMIGKAKGQIDGKLADSEVAVEYGNKAPAISVDGLLLLPDTSPIESSYRAAVVGVGLLPQTAIDLVINKAPTAGIEWFGQSPIGLGLEAERISTYRNLPPGMSRGDALALLSRDVMATSYAMYAQAVLGTGHTPAESLIAFRGLSTLFRSGNTIKLETIGAYSYYSNEGTHTAAMIDKGGDGVAWHDGKIIKVSPDNFRKNDKGGFDIRLDNGSWVGAGLDDNRMAPSFAAIEKSKDEVLVRATSGGRLVASLVDHTAGELSYIETTYKGHSEDSGVAAIKTVHGRHHSIFVLDGNASRAPDGVVVGPNQFYIDSKYKTLNAVAKATGGSVSALLGLNTGLALASGSTIIDAGTLIELPKPTHLINIDIKTDPTPQLGSQAEGQAAQDVRNGFVENSATTRVSFSDNTLNRTDFTSTQMGSLATGGVRPGEMELDPNAKPGAHLGRFYIDPVATQNRNAAHMNSAVLNGLSAMTTVNTYIDPILMDLTGRGVKTTGIDNGVLFDIDHSGTVKRTGWADAGTGMLVVNNGNDQITDASQMLSEYFGGKAGSNGGPGETRFKDSFGALESIDTHRDGVIDQNDPIWSKLRVWVDRNHDGKSGPRELKTLEALGITQIQVKPHFSAGEMQNGNEVIARGTFTMKGQTRELMAVNFLADPVGNAFVQVKGGMKVSSTSEGATRTAFTSTRSVKEKLDAAKLGVDNVYAGKGDTTLIAAANGSWLVGGGGSNTYRGGAGDDVFVVSARDNPRNIRGNGGRDTVIIVGDRGMTLNMAQSGLTIAQGGRGDDVILSGGNRSVFIKGGQGHTTMVGGGGNDVLVGGSGQNTIIGGSSRAVIYAGPKGDTI
ncbi:MAG TPA: hypothetical protein VL424_10295, partial [Pararobbsia sp.]|nr:hypothetical protein [Pararobbsia sp.]